METNNTNTELLTVEEVQKILRYKHYQSIYNLVCAKKLKATKPTGKLLFRRQDVEDFINSGQK